MFLSKPFVSLYTRLISLFACVTAAAQLLSPVARPLPSERTAETYRYLAIGNSITRHPVCDYWWNEIGMAASEEDRDYFHLVAGYLEEKHESVEARAVNFVEWELAAQNRSATFDLLDPELTEDLDLITVQLSENAPSSRKLNQDIAGLLRHIKAKCPNARIILVDDFWDRNKSKEKRKAAQAENVSFADFKAIRGNPAYQCKIGDIVYDADGAPHAIERQDVAKHPNDAGMTFIAQIIIQQLERLP